jgi:hypothetical protein
MSLKSFHLVFISASILLALGFGAWEMNAWFDARATLDLVMGSLSLLAGVGLLVYGRYFLKKLRNVSYL